MYFLKDFLFVIVILDDYLYEIVVLNSNNIKKKTKPLFVQTPWYLHYFPRTREVPFWNMNSQQVLVIYCESKKKLD